ncbi:hypothetical protein BDZ91DRAFT_734094 [Kalaharituber pfeilii]|nr:hypothetical protein BDZ91DRAFT_734094 [Kalaharituber pfeilii]
MHICHFVSFVPLIILTSNSLVSLMFFSCKPSISVSNRNFASIVAVKPAKFVLKPPSILPPSFPITSLKSPRPLVKVTTCSSNLLTWSQKMIIIARVHCCLARDSSLPEALLNTPSSSRSTVYLLN